MAEKVCPVWVGYLLSCPVRKLFQNPQKILSSYIEDGMKVLDVGCAMGFFSLPLARMVGPNGKVVCVDMQVKMIKALEKGARKAGLSTRIETRMCTQTSLKLTDTKEEFDFALAAAVVHEVPDTSLFFSEIFQTIKGDGKILVIEPKGHISKKDFEISISLAKKNGLKIIDRPAIPRSHAVLLGKLNSALIRGIS